MWKSIDVINSYRNNGSNSTSSGFISRIVRIILLKTIDAEDVRNIEERL